jgi:hypothetical protein
MREIVPPESEVPFPPSDELVAVVIVFAQKKWSIEIKHVEKGIIIEHVDRCGK